MSEPPATAPAATPRAGSLYGFRIGWTAFIVLLTTVPYLINWRDTPPGYHYTWILPPYPEDSLAYQAWAQQAAHGSILFQDKYTAIPHAPFLFHPFFLLAGWISGLTGCEVGVALLILKAAGVVIFFAVLYRYLDWLKLDRLQSISATVLAGISSGFGGLIIMSGLGAKLPASGMRWPVPVVDALLPDVNTFWSLLWNPLFPYSLTLLVLVMFWMDRGTREGRSGDFWKAGLATGLLALVHPYTQPVVLVCVMAMALARWRRETVRWLVQYALAAAPLVLYVVSVTVFNPVVARHDVQGRMTSPPLSSYVYGYGIPLLLMGAGLALFRQSLVRRWWPLIMWFTISVAFAYLPIWFQRKLVFGSHVPLCILAGVTFGGLVSGLANRTARAVALILGVAVLLPLSATTSYYLLLNGRAETQANADGSYYVPDEIMDGMKFLRKEGKPQTVVCAGLETSKLIPAIAGNTVLWGHWAMTVDNAERQQWFDRLFGANANFDDPKRAEEFWGAGIQYIFAEGGLKNSIEQNPQAWRAILAQTDVVYTNRLVTIYELRLSFLGSGSVSGEKLTALSSRAAGRPREISTPPDK